MGDYAIVARLAAREEQLPEVSRFIVLDEAFFYACSCVHCVWDARRQICVHDVYMMARIS